MELELLRLSDTETADADIRDLEDRLREQPERQQRPAPRLMKASALRGAPVRNAAGERLGRIEDIVLDRAGGRIAYAALSCGGWRRRKLLAVPWYALTRNEAEHEFIFNVERRVLEQAPGFDRNCWPGRADIDWLTGGGGK